MFNYQYFLVLATEEWNTKNSKVSWCSIELGREIVSS
jgi:hypothetical protein